MKPASLLALLAAAASTLAAPLADADADPAPALAKRQSLAAVYTKCTRANTVALTFDDGPYIYQQDIINRLNTAGIKATFFINGNNWRCVYDTGAVASLQSAFNTGHQIASHTWAHRDLNTLTWDQIHDEMWRVELAMRRIIGRAPAHMRPPYGNYNNLVRQASLVRNQSIITWDFDSGDSVGVAPSAQKQRYTDIANQHPSNILSLQHETYSSSAYDVLPHAISVLQARGYTFATVAECLGQAPYSWTGSPSPRDSSWVC